MEQGVAAIRAAKVQGRKAVAFFRRESGAADFAKELSFGSVVPIEIGRRGLAARAGTLFGNIAFFSAGNRPDEPAITFLPVRDQFLVGPVLCIGLDEGKLINFEFLVFRGMRIIESPLL
jgi:hypothetical protein